MGYAFISYSSKQQADADKLRLLLQNNHIDTWMAPHDLPQGADYADVINDVIRDAACVVLLLTEDTQSSVFVDKEIERALHYGKTIAPIQLGQVELNDSFAFYLCNQQIAMVSALDESMPKMQALLRHLNYLCNDRLPSGDSSVDAARDRRVRRKRLSRLFCWSGTVFWFFFLFLGYQYVNTASRISFDMLYDPEKLPSLPRIAEIYGLFFLLATAALLLFLYGAGLKNPKKKSWNPLRVFPKHLVLPSFSVFCATGSILLHFLAASVSGIVYMLEHEGYPVSGYQLPQWIVPATWGLGLLCVMTAVISLAMVFWQRNRKRGDR